MEWQSQIESLKKSILDPIGHILGKQDNKNTILKVRGKVQQIMEQTAKRQIALMRQLEQLGLPPASTQLVLDENKRSMEDLAAILDEVDFDEEQEHKTSGSAFQSCLDVLSKGLMESQLSNLPPLQINAPEDLEDNTKFNTSYLSIIDEENQQVYSFSKRTQLPYLKDPSQKVSYIKILKDMVGKDLTKISLPVILNEPIGFLQKNTELF